MRDKLLTRWIIISILFPFLDVLSTILFTSKFGIASEGNLIGRFLMNELGLFAFPIMYLFAYYGLLLLFLFIKKCSIPIYYFFGGKKVSKKEEIASVTQGLTIGSYLIILLYSIVLFHNFSAFFR